MKAHRTASRYQDGCRCPDCTQAWADYVHARRERFRAKGLCTVCGGPRPPGARFVTCTTCRVTDASRLRARRAKNKGDLTPR